MEVIKSLIMVFRSNEIFNKTFPCTNAAWRRKKEMGRDMEKEFEGKTMFIIDDDGFLLKAAKRKFETMGFLVTTADSGEAALGILNNIAADVILLDCEMGEGMDGHETAEQIYELQAESNEKSAVVAFGSGFDEIDLNELHFSAYMPKYTDTEDMKKTLRKLLLKT